MDAAAPPGARSPETPAADGGAARRWLRATLRIAAGAGVALIVLGTVSLVLDSRLAAWALTLPNNNVRWGAFMSALGSSWWMFAAAAPGTALLWGLEEFAGNGPARPALRQGFERAAFLLATLGAEVVAVQTVKHLVGRARPRDFRSFGPYHFDVLSLTDELASFPSGHACTSFAVATVVALLFPRYRVAGFTMATAVALSRVVVQAHYLSDILAGGALGCGTALVMARTFARRNVALTRTADGRIVPKGLASPRVPRPRPGAPA